VRALLEAGADLNQERAKRSLSPTLFGAIVLAFFFPFGSGFVGGCGPNARVEFTGVELATWRVEHAVPGDLPRPAEEAISQFENDVSPWAFLALGAAVGGFAFGVRDRGKGTRSCAIVGLTAIGLLEWSLAGGGDFLGGHSVDREPAYLVVVVLFILALAWEVVLGVIAWRRHTRRRLSLGARRVIQLGSAPDHGWERNWP
jgi:hypothetical protein